jgi:hypothetical protein
MPTSSEIDLLRQNSMAMLEYNEETVAVGRERQVFPHRQSAFDAWDAHSQADEPPLSFVMEFNAAEREWHEEQARPKNIQLQMERIQPLTKAQQCFVMQMIDTVVAQQGR